MDKPDFYTPNAISQHLGVSPATVYAWLENSENEDWPHQPIPEPMELCKNISPNAGIFSPIWKESQISEWRAWYEVYKNNKGKRPSADQGDS